VSNQYTDSLAETQVAVALFPDLVFKMRLEWLGTEILGFEIAHLLNHDCGVNNIRE